MIKINITEKDNYKVTLPTGNVQFFTFEEYDAMHEMLMKYSSDTRTAVTYWGICSEVDSLSNLLTLRN